VIPRSLIAADRRQRERDLLGTISIMGWEEEEE